LSVSPWTPSAALGGRPTTTTTATQGVIQ
jgi:hypothetical protein